MAIILQRRIPRFGDFGLCFGFCLAAGGSGGGGGGGGNGDKD